MKKILIFLVIILAFAAGFYIYTKPVNAPMETKNQEQVPLMQNKSTPSPTGTDSIEQPLSPSYTPPDMENGGEVTAPDIQVYEVDFTGTAFEPANLQVKKGDYVFFVNKSLQEFWPFSEDEDHLGFNSQKAIKPEAQYRFQFLKPGVWNYSDKLNPNITGLVEVSP